MSGIILVFIPCLGSFLTPDLLGGANAVMIGNVIERQFKAATRLAVRRGAVPSCWMYFLRPRRALGAGRPQERHGALRMATEATQRLPAGAPLSLQRLVTAAEQGPLDYGSRLWLKVLIGLVFVALYAPILALIALLQRPKRPRVAGLHHQYYPVAWENQALIEAMVNSLTIALMCTLFATVIGAAALSLWRFRFPLQVGLHEVHGAAHRRSPRSAWGWRCSCSSPAWGAS